MEASEIISITFDPYFIYLSLFPCVIYALICVYSYYLVRIFKKTYNKAASNLSEDSENAEILIPKDMDIHYDSIATSYYIKQRLSLVVCLSLFLQSLYEVLLLRLEWTCIHVLESSFWVMSALLLKYDYGKPNFYKQGLFWLLSFLVNTFTLTRFIQKNDSSMDTAFVILYAFRSIVETVLCLYGIFKYDDEDYQKNWLTNILDKIEGLPNIPKIFCFQIPIPEMTKSTELKSMSPFLISPASHLTFSQRFNSNSAENHIEVKLDRFISLNSPILNSNFCKICYSIRTFIRHDVYVSDKSLFDFEKLLISLKNLPNIEACETKNFVENLVFYEEDPNNSEQLLQLIEQMENFLQKIANDPQYFCTIEVLTFLMILKKNRKHIRLFPKFQRYSKTYELSPVANMQNLTSLDALNSLELGNINMNLHPFNNIELFDSELSSSLLKNFFFKISALDYSKNPNNNQIEYHFQITNLSTIPMKTWEISKTFPCFQKLNNDLEKQKGEKIPLFKGLLPKGSNSRKSTDEAFLVTRKDALLRYLQTLIQRFPYHGEVLYNFIGFDPEKGNPYTPFARSSALLRTNSPRFVEKQRENVIFHHIYEERDEDKFRNPLTLNKKFNSLINLHECKKQIVNGINFNLVQINLRSVKGIVMKNSGNDSLCVFYNVDLKETFYNRHEIRTLLKVTKQYKDFVNLTELVNILISNLGFQEIDLPSEILFGDSFALKAAKIEWDAYFERLRNSPRIEENESFKEFFCLNLLRSNFQYDRKKYEEYNWTY